MNGGNNMICQKCKNEIPEGSAFCPKCGAKIATGDTKGSIKNGFGTKRGKGLIIGAGGLVSVIAIIGIVYMVLINSNPVKKYTYLFDQDNSKEAIEVYNKKIEGNTELENELSDTQNTEIDDIYKQFKDRKLSYEDAKKQVQKYTQYVPSKQYATDIMGQIEALNGSRTAYEAAQKAENDGDAETAISKYKAVIEEDDSYTEAQQKIEELENTFKTQLLNEAESYGQNKQYTEAISDIDKIISVLGTSEDLESLKQQYSEMKSEQYAKIVVVDKSVTPMDSSKWIFNNYVDMVFDVTNNSDKAIKGIEGTLTVSDLFDKEIISIGCDFTGHTIQPGETYRESDFSYECNQFVNTDMKFFNTEFSDLKFAYDITNIVYEDGTTVTPE